MTADCDKLTLAAQSRFFRLAEREGHTLKSLSIDSGIKYGTLRTYKGTKGAQACMSLGAVRALSKVEDLSDELLSLLIDGTGRHVAADKGDEGDHDTLATNCIEFAGRHAQARHPKSPGGVAIVEVEDQELRACSRKLRAA